MAFAQKGLSIEGGIIYDRPVGDMNSRPFDDMRPGFGYTANIGFDFFERGGLELGVIRSTHSFDLYTIGGATAEETADKTSFFLRLRGSPLKREKFAVIVAAGPGYFDISGETVIQGNIVAEGYSGWGITTSSRFRYSVTPGLAISIYFGVNLVNYSRYDLLGYNTDYPGDLPNGNSLTWGLTFFHCVGSLKH